MDTKKMNAKNAERIVVSEAFRVCQTNCSFKMEFRSKVDMRKAYEAMETAVMAIADQHGYYQLWLQDLCDCCDAERFDINSTLYSFEFNEYVPAMCKAVAEALPTVGFEAYAYYDDLKCYWVDEFEVVYKDNLLSITESFADDDCGYFCPECGCQVGTVGMILESDEIICDDCEERIRVSDLKYVPPAVTKSEYPIK